MEISKLIARARVLVPATLMFVTLNSFSQQVQEAPENNRSDVIYKQVHSSILSEQSGLFADGLKLKLDLSVLDEVEEERENFDPEDRSEEHTSELQSRPHLVCRLLLEK